MRKVVGYLLMSLDGVVEEPSDWLEHFDEDARDNMVEVINAQDTVLLGRVMYQEWAAYWPTATDELSFTGFINNVPKYVVSTTLSSVDEWQPATLIKSDVFQEIAQLKQKPGKNIGAHGSITLIRFLLDHGLLDELVLVVFPVLAGHGRHLLTEENSLQKLKLVSSKPTRTGALILNYQVIQR